MTPLICAPLAQVASNLIGWGETATTAGPPRSGQRAMTIEEVRGLIESDRSRLDDIGRHL